MNCTVFLEHMIIGFQGHLLKSDKVDDLTRLATEKHGVNIVLENIENHMYSIEADVYLVIEYCTPVKKAS